ncbi:helix-turn-helix domain-containing protein [Collimonas silvisoli]|uniref:helix-turn-helix domain-containing protein n=1 Tax=Collimonas silvisoli TaxID=2825884 RepID=UPI001B8BEE4D|nr:helix-turn-helix transcriptional regulator [Collimonas silvisoli]
MKKTQKDIQLAKAVGKMIAKRRDEAGLTQDVVAERLGVGYEAVSRMERGLSMPTVGKLIQLAEIFNCSVGKLLIESSNRAEDQSMLIASMISKLSEENRTFVLEILEKLSSHLTEG